VDAVSDPVVGSLSDQTRHRLGRRHPWLYAAPIPLAVVFILLFRPPEGLGQGGLFAWLFVFAVLTRIAITLFHVPHMALGAELSDDYGERTTIVAFRAFFGVSGAATASIVGLGVFFAATPEIPDGQLNAAAYPRFAWAAAAGMVAAMYLCAFGTHHRIPTLKGVAAGAEPFTLGRVWREMREALANASFRALFIGIVIFFVTRGVQTTLGLHMGTYLWELTTSQILDLNLALIAGFFVGLPFWTVVSRSLDKRPTFLLGVGIFSLFVFLPPVMWILGVFPDRESAAYLPTLLGMSFVAAFGGTAGIIAAGSMMADIADEHELHFGRRQEGIFFGALAFAGKSASGLGHGIAGLGIDAIGFPLQAAPGQVSHEVLVRLGILYGPGILLLAIIAFFFLMQYRIDRARHVEILAALAARRAAAT
jgi:Na+/melibiose symporter-like transporter